MSQWRPRWADVPLLALRRMGGLLYPFCPLCQEFRFFAVTADGVGATDTKQARPSGAPQQVRARARAQRSGLVLGLGRRLVRF